MNWNDIFTLSSALAAGSSRQRGASGVSHAEYHKLRRAYDETFRAFQELHDANEQKDRIIQDLRAELDRTRSENESLRAQLAGRM